MGPVARLVEQVFGAPGDDFLAEGDEGLDQLLEIEELRPAPSGRETAETAFSSEARR